MLGRIYTLAFFCFFGFALYYQREYLNKTSEEFHAQLDFENAILPTNIVKDFYSKNYEFGFLKSITAGNSLTYFSNAHFEANGNLVYEEYNKEKKATYKIYTEEANGQMDVAGDDSSLSLENNSRIKYVILPKEVRFFANENKGQTSNVYIDTINHTLHSKNPINMHGPQGSLQGKGFDYSTKDGDFSIKEKVSGEVIVPPKKDNQ